MSGNWSDDLERRHYEKKEQSNSGGGKKFNPWDMERVQLNVGETFYMRILPPVDRSVYSYAHHWPAGKPKFSCTRDHAAFQNPELVGANGEMGGGMCNYCVAFPPKTRGKRQLKDVLEVVDFRYYHIVPDPKGKRDDAETIERCAHDEPDGDIRNNRCHNCNSDDERGKVRYFGGHKVLELAEYQYNQVWAAHEKLSHTCIAVVGEDADGPVICKKKNYLLCFICRHCENYMMDEETAKKTPTLAKQKFKQSRQTCGGCNTADFPYPVFACDGKGRSRTPSEAAKNDAPVEGEHWVVRGSMFDKVLEVTVAGETKNLNGKDITLKNLNVSTGEAWSALSVDLNMFGFSEEEIVEMCKPWDLNHRYRPSFKLKPEDFTSTGAWAAAVLAEQAENIGHPNAFGGDGGGGGNRSFGSSGSRRAFKAT